jgi:hypothetical protein
MKATVRKLFISNVLNAAGKERIRRGEEYGIFLKDRDKERDFSKDDTILGIFPDGFAVLLEVTEYPVDGDVLKLKVRAIFRNGRLICVKLPVKTAV